MKKSQTILTVFLLLSIIAFFLPWLNARVLIDGEDRSTTNYGYHYIIPLGARYTAPVAILCFIGFILSAYSLKETGKVRILNVLAGSLILIGAISAFFYTSSAALDEVAGSFNFSVSVSVEYGFGLEALFGFLMLVVTYFERDKWKETVAKPLAYVGIVLGILAVGIFPVVVGPIAIILGAIALIRATEEERTLCFVAIAMGIIGLILGFMTEIIISPPFMVLL